MITLKTLYIPGYILIVLFLTLTLNPRLRGIGSLGASYPVAQVNGDDGTAYRSLPEDWTPKP